MTESSTFAISRTFDAPRRLVWDAFTRAEHLKHWMGPKGVSMVECTVDLKPGGIFLYAMKAPDGAVMWGKWIFREIVPPERLVVVVTFSDAQGGVTRHPFAPDWPLYTLATTTLTERGGKTTVALAWQALDASDAERAAFDGGHDSMRMGWTGTFDQLEAYLKTA